MKRYNNLWDKICTLDNFELAYKLATKGKSHYLDVRRIKRIGVTRYLKRLLKEVESGEYKVSEYKIFKRKTGGKVRVIYKLPMKDRIVQHAIMIHIEPIFRESFIQDTFSSIKGRGIHLALQRVKRALKDTDYKYAIKIDVHKCYPSLDQNILKQKLFKKFKDKKLMNLLTLIIDSCDEGVPIGNYTSQYFNNFYFNDFDHKVKEQIKIKYYFRYCDDMLFFVKTIEEAMEILAMAKQEMTLLNVRIKDEYQLYDIEKDGVDFVGYVSFRTHIKIRKETKREFIKKVSKMDFDNLTRKDINVLGSYWGIFVHADCRNLWYKYVKVKTFADLKIKVRKRLFVEDIVDKEIVVNNASFYWKKKEKWLRLNIDLDENKDVLVPTQAELLFEAAEQMNNESFPFMTKIITNEKGYYEFT